MERFSQIKNLVSKSLNENLLVQKLNDVRDVIMYAWDNTKFRGFDLRRVHGQPDSYYVVHLTDEDRLNDLYIKITNTSINLNDTSFKSVDEVFTRYYLKLSVKLKKSIN